MSSTNERPFSSLSKDPGHPYSTWDEPDPLGISPLGRLALITKDLVALAAREQIQTGERISCDLTIRDGRFAHFGRKKADRTVKRIDAGPESKEAAEAKGERWHPKHDDLLHINTQVR